MLASLFHKLFIIPGDADAVRRGRSLILIALVLMGASLLGVIFVIFQSDAPIITFISTLSSGLLMGGAIWLTRRGMISTAGALLIICMLASLLAPIFIAGSNSTLSLLYLSIPVVVSGMIMRPWLVWMVTLVALGIILGKTYAAPIEDLSQELAQGAITNSMIMLIILGAVSQLGAYNVQTSFGETDAAMKLAAEAAARLEHLNADLEIQVGARTAELQAAFRDAEARANEKQVLLDEIASQRAMIREMSVPVLPVRAGTLVMPLVGDLDGERLETIQSRALEAIEGGRASTLLIDLTGVPLVDTYVAQGLIRTMQAARLLGATPVLIGIRPEVAQSMVSLGIDLSDVRTEASLESALSR